MIQFISEHIDWVSVKLTLGTITLAALTGSGVAILLSCLAALSTIAYNAYRVIKDLKNKK